MTESITAPFTLTTREACETAYKVLTGPEAPMTKSEVKMRVVTSDELPAFTERLRKRRMEIRGY